MIGNDVVDLAVAKKENNWRRKGYLEKLFTNQEITLIQQAKNQDFMVWNLWSRKEAAYKIFIRETGKRAFMPLQLSCEYSDEHSGTVSCQGSIYYTKTIMDLHKVYTVAATTIELLEQIVTLNDRKQVLKKGGIPYLIDVKSQQEFPVSITHHGDYEYIITVASLLNS